MREPTGPFRPERKPHISKRCIFPGSCADGSKANRLSLFDTGISDRYDDWQSDGLPDTKGTVH
jgi:hypothetical protein